MVSSPGTPSQISKPVVLRSRKRLVIGLASSAIALLASVMVAGEDTDSKVISFIPPRKRALPPPDQRQVVDLSKPRDPRDPPVPLIDSRFVRSTGVGNEESTWLDLSLEKDLHTVRNRSPSAGLVNSPRHAHSAAGVSSE